MLIKIDDNNKYIIWLFIQSGTRVTNMISAVSI